MDNKNANAPEVINNNQNFSAMAFGTGTAVTRTTSSGDKNIDAVTYSLKWTDPNVTFSFPDSFTNDYEPGYPQEHASTFKQLSTIQQQTVRNWAEEFNQVSNLNLTELTGGADRDATIRIASSDVPNMSTTYHPNSYTTGGDRWVGQNQYYDDPKIGTYSTISSGYELGSAVGLKAGHTYGSVDGAIMDSSRDTLEFSIMSHHSYEDSPTDTWTNAYGGFPQSLMMYDIAAIQNMYGADFNSEYVGSRYSFSTTTGEMTITDWETDEVIESSAAPASNIIFRTIWDNLGWDIYDFSNYTTKLNIDLTPGGWSDVDTESNFQAAYLGDGHLGDGHYARGQVYNALLYQDDQNSYIEDAYGGSNDDIITGNLIDNRILGGAGNDTIYGKEGFDTIIGEDGDDTMIGGQDYDDYYVDSKGDEVIEELNAGTDTVNSAVDYTLTANVENLYLLDYNLNPPPVFGTGNNLHNTITGNNANNILDGREGNDTLIGDEGNDTLIGWSGADTMSGGIGDDTYMVENVGDVVTEKLNEGIDLINSKVTHKLSAHVENLTLSCA